MSGRQYKDSTGNPCSLRWLVNNEPEWAINQIIHRDKLESERDALQARVKRLEEALGLVLKMHNDWLEMQEDGYAGAYYAFVKGNDHEWDSIMKAKEPKP